MRAAVIVVLLAGCGRWGFDTQTGGVGDAAELADGGSLDALDAPDRANRIFMSSTTHDGNLGGLAGADALCQQTANAASLGGTFVALLWTTSSKPSDRVAGSRGWVDLAGTPIADHPVDLDAASLNPLRHDEAGLLLPEFTYALWGGQVGSGTCTDWTSNVTGGSQPHEVPNNASFDTDTYGQCENQSHLICAETGHSAAVAPAAQLGRIAFITQGNWLPGGGLAAADAFCQGEASAASLAGTYLAFLPTAAASAESRFSTAGLPWQRVDGTRITQTAAQLVGATPSITWDSFIARTATGAETKIRVWTGTLTNNCASWTSSTTAMATIGASDGAHRNYLQLFPAGCASQCPLICLQQ